MISDEDKERVRQASDLLQIVGETVELKQRGRDFWGCCPFHKEKSPSFHVVPQNGIWHCFGCGEGGDVFAYIMKREGLDFPDSIRYLAEKAGIELSEERGAARRGPKRNRLIECLGEAESFYSLQLMRGKSDGAAEGRSYLGGRGFGSAVCKSWGLGYAPGHGALVAHLRSKGFTNQEMVAANLALDGRGNNLRDRFFDRVMFPIHDEMGRTIAFSGRVLTQGKPAQGGKYVNSSETAVFSKKRHLFAFDRAKESMAATGKAIICEGYTDVMAMHQAGFTNTVATMGTALTAEHVKLLDRFAKRQIICLFDGDAAGQRAAERVVQFMGTTSADFVCVVLPDNQDPMEFLSSHDPKEMEELLERPTALMSFVFEKRLAGYDLAVPGQRVDCMRDMAQLLAPLKGSYLLDQYAQSLSNSLSVDAGEIKRLVSEAKVTRPDDVAPARGGSRTSGRAASGQRAQARPAQRGGSASAAAPAATAVVDDDLDRFAGYDFAEGDPDDPYADMGQAAAAPAATSFSAAPGVDLGAFSKDMRMQNAAECELLAMIASHPDTMRPYSERIASFSWVDRSHENVAWAMLATPQGTSPMEVVAAAEAVEPQAASILAQGRLESESTLTHAQRAEFLLDLIELCSCEREVRRISGNLTAASSTVPDEDSRALMQTATELQKRIYGLRKRLSGSV
ncbi:DNA primase [Olsenella intestinalis]|uniref:DNA primase n=1 Tax=Olsenella intestinalis TaxID=2930083 RepID=UPI00200C4CF4|nr:DNA primase [Olsenella intestinalis]